MSAIPPIASNVLLAPVEEDRLSISWDEANTVAVSFDTGSQGLFLVLMLQSTGTCIVREALQRDTVWRASQLIYFSKLTVQGTVRTVALKFPDAKSADDLQKVLPKGSDSALVDTKSKFDKKIDKGSAELYFHYYGMLMHQQNMLQDYTRTGTYYAAIIGNRPDFEGKIVMDVGAGSGILSLFAAQAGAKKVYAVEASDMAKFARHMADSNPALGSRIEVINSKVEEVVLREKADVLVSEPMGTLLVNERMLESFIYARDNFLKPGGKLFPQIGRIHVAAFQDEALYVDVANKALFWMQPNFYGVDVTSLYYPALESYFAQVVVDAFDPSILVTNCATKILDFSTIDEASLLYIDMPLQLQVGTAPCTLHGIACWFDVFFNGSTTPTWLSTAPGLPTTHWFQLRCVLQQPLVVMVPGTVITGRLQLKAHSRQSYDVLLNLSAPALQPGQPPQISAGKYDLKEPYYRQLTSWYQTNAGEQVSNSHVQDKPPNATNVSSQ